MTKANPGAIIMLAVGAIFLSLGWSGRYPAVFEAFRTGRTDSAETTPADVPNSERTPDQQETEKLPGTNSGTANPNTGSTIIPGTVLACTRGSYGVKRDAGKGYECFEPRDMQWWPTTQGGIHCATGWEPGRAYNTATGSAQSSGVPVCVRSGAGTKATQMPGGGQVEMLEDYAEVRMPNGTMAVRYQPNVRGMFE